MATDSSLCKKLLNVKEPSSKDTIFITIQMAFSIFESKSDHMLSTKIIARSAIAHVPDMTNRRIRLAYGAPRTGAPSWSKSKVSLIESTVLSTVL